MHFQVVRKTFNSKLTGATLKKILSIQEIKELYRSKLNAVIPLDNVDRGNDMSHSEILDNSSKKVEKWLDHQNQDMRSIPDKPKLFLKVQLPSIMLSTSKAKPKWIKPGLNDTSYDI